jgi:hypothetical protein
MDKTTVNVTQQVYLWPESDTLFIVTTAPHWWMALVEFDDISLPPVPLHEIAEFKKNGTIFVGDL